MKQTMETTEKAQHRQGRIVAGVGGLYTVRDEMGQEYQCRAKGAFRHDGLTPTVGDRVMITLLQNGDAAEDVRVEQILPRKNVLLRPAMANLDVLFFVIAAKDPDPSLRFIDKQLAILEYQKITPVLVITKCDLDAEKAEKLRVKYEKCGYAVILTDYMHADGDDEVLSYLQAFDDMCVAAFSGVSGVGKSTLMNRLFPALQLETGEISVRIARGRHTTRTVSLYALSELTCGRYHGYLADTPGFSMLDFTRFDFFSSDALPYTFREFVPYIGHCRYTKCTHTKEEGCAIMEAVAKKEIPKSRHTSYVELYDVLKSKNAWNT